MKRITKSGKIILTGADYTALRHAVYDRMKAEDEEGIPRCDDCAKPIRFQDMQLHHTEKRGGGKRDDVLEKAKGLCNQCHIFDRHTVITSRG